MEAYNWRTHVSQFDGPREGDDKSSLIDGIVESMELINRLRNSSKTGSEAWHHLSELYDTTKQLLEEVTRIQEVYDARL